MIKIKENPKKVAVALFIGEMTYRHVTI